MPQNNPLGYLLNPPSNSPRPAPRVQPQQTITGEPARGATDGLLTRLMSSPQGQAFMMQTIASLLGQQGIAGSLGQGIAAAGRAATTNAQLAAQRDQEAFSRQQTQRKGSGSGSPKTTDQEKFQEARARWLQEFAVDYEPTEAARLATYYAMQELGMADALAWYGQLVGEEQEVFLDQMLDGPQAWASLTQRASEAATARTARLRATEDPPAGAQPAEPSAASTLPSTAPVATPGPDLPTPTSPGGTPNTPRPHAAPPALEGIQESNNYQREQYLQLLSVGQPEAMARAMSGYRGN